MKPSPAPFRSRAWIAVALAWLLCCVAMAWVLRDAIGTLAFRDTDDAMRLQQVRDWIAGQSFYDISQHRVNPPVGGPMHWSRIVDMPIAALILLLRPLLGMATAEILACVLVPILLLGGAAAILFVAARRIAGEAVAVAAAIMLLITPSILYQFAPLRIDHHGWQIGLATLALLGAMDDRRARGGMIAALALAVWLQISSEALPYVALFAALFALRHWLTEAEAARFVSFSVTLGVAALLLLIALRGTGALSDQACDALSFVYLMPLLVLAIATPVADRLLGRAHAYRRFMVAAIGGGAAIIALLFSGGRCLSGDPFQALGPLAYRIWYLHVMEGQPIWAQPIDSVGMVLLPVIAGFIGMAMAVRASHDPADRARWLALALLLAGASAITLLILRAISVAHVFALPGIAWMLLALRDRINTSRFMAARVLGIAALVLITPIGLTTLWISLTAKPATGQAASNHCRAPSVLAPLRALPPATLFAPLDLGPAILAGTGHSVIGTPHHRNAAGITAVIQGFVDRPDAARGVIMALNGGKGADYVVICPALNEMGSYRNVNEAGLAAVLMRNDIPGWLRPLPGKGPLRIYKIVDQAGRNRIATPFMQ